MTTEQVAVSSQQTVPLSEAARQLGVPYHTVWELLCAGGLPAHKVKGRWFVSQAVLADLKRRHDEWQQKRRALGPSPLEAVPLNLGA